MSNGVDKLIKFYETIVEYIKYGLDVKKFLTYELDGKTKRVTYQGMEICLPTRENLKAFDPEKHLIFHPAIEQANRSESTVLSIINRALNFQLNDAVLVLIDAFLGMAVEKAKHKHFNPAQRELITSIPEVTEAEYNRILKKLLEVWSTNQYKMFVSIYIRRGGTFAGAKHPAVGVVSFPLYDFLNSPEAKAMKFTANEIAVLKGLMEFIFPGSNPNDESYNSFSDSPDSPRLFALLETGKIITDRINEIIEDFDGTISGGEGRTFVVEWEKYVHHPEIIQEGIRAIPIQRGNYGTVETPEEENKQRARTTPEGAGLVVPAPAQQVGTVPVPVPATAAVGTMDQARPTITLASELQRLRGAQSPLQAVVTQNTNAARITNAMVGAGVLHPSALNQAPAPVQNGLVDIRDVQVVNTPAGQIFYDAWGREVDPRRINLNSIGQQPVQNYNQPQQNNTGRLQEFFSRNGGGRGNDGGSFQV